MLRADIPRQDFNTPSGTWHKTTQQEEIVNTLSINRSLHDNSFKPAEVFDIGLIKIKYELELFQFKSPSYKSLSAEKEEHWIEHNAL